MEKRIAVLGATGSVGTQTLDVARFFGYGVDLLTASKNVALAEKLAREFHPRFFAMADEAAAQDLKTRLSDTDITVLSGAAGITEGIRTTDADTVVNAVLGAAGLSPTLAAVAAGKPLALANKESLVIAGDIVMSKVRENRGVILPVDSEHSAIFQSLAAGKKQEVKKILLTASGGPFRGYSAEKLGKVTLADTLSHPTWRMGKKITVDSATMMNKGFEIIEAVHLFGVSPSAIEVLIHKESIIHSAVEYLDNTVIAEMAVPDMRACIQYAVNYPDRLPGATPELSLTELMTLTFEKPDTQVFPLLSLAREAADAGGGMGAVLNAADEVAVEAFLCEKIAFSDISPVVAEAYAALSDAKDAVTLPARMEADAAARAVALELIQKRMEKRTL